MPKTKIPLVLKKAEFFGAAGFPVVIASRNPQPVFPCHRHQFAEIVVVTGGSGLHGIRNEEYPVAAGDVFVIAGHAPHEYRNMKDLTLINVLYDPAQLGMDNWDVQSLPGYRAMFALEPAYRQRHKFASRLRLNMEDLSAVIAMIAKLEDELVQRAPGFQLLATARFMELVVFLSRCYGRSRATASRSLMRIAAAITHLEQHSAEEITLAQLSCMAHMSRRTFTRAFRSAMGDSPLNYLIGLRIAKAARLIRAGDAKLTGIAFETGFADSNYFARQFRRVMGCTPQQYRRRAKVPDQ